MRLGKSTNIFSQCKRVFGRYIHKRLPTMKKTFGIWKPTNLGITGLLFVAAIIHMTTALGGKAGEFG